MIEVKPSIRGAAGDPNLFQYLSNEENRCGDVRISVNEGSDSADVWFVVEESDDEDNFCTVPTGSAFLLSAETSWPPGLCADPPECRTFAKSPVWSEAKTCASMTRRW